MFPAAPAASPFRLERVMKIRCSTTGPIMYLKRFKFMPPPFLWIIDEEKQKKQSYINEIQFSLT
jgi:hypothetical protein